jgi:hypothetical protein
MKCRLWPPEVSPCAASEKQTSSSLRRRLDALMPAIMILLCQRKGNLRNQRRNLCQSLLCRGLFLFLRIIWIYRSGAHMCSVTRSDYTSSRKERKKKRAVWMICPGLRIFVDWLDNPCSHDAHHRVRSEYVIIIIRGWPWQLGLFFLFLFLFFGVLCN